LSIPFDIAFGFAAGSAIALAAKRPLVRTHEPVRSRYFAVAALFGAAAMTPRGLIFYLVAPDWSLMYFANPAHLPKLMMLPLLILLYAGAPVAGFLTAHRLMRLERTVFLTSMMIVLALALAAILILGGHRILTVAYYDAFHLGAETIPIFRSRLAVALPLAATSIAVLLVASIIHVRKHVAITETLPGEGLEQTPRLAERLAMDTHDPIGAGK